MSTRRLPNPLVLLLLAGGLPGLPVVGPAAASAQSAIGSLNRLEVSAVRFEGNASVPARALANAIRTRPTECRSFVLRPLCWYGADFSLIPSFLRERELANDLARIQIFYYQRGFREARVDTTVVRVPEENRAEITFLIQEGRPIVIDSLRLVGLDAAVDQRGLLDRLPVRVGDPLDLLALDAARDTLTARLQNRGYAHTDVLRSLFIPQDTYRASVEYDIHTGPTARFGPIEVLGNQEVSETVVRRMLPFRDGDPYRRDLIFEAQRNLFNLEIFRHASVSQDLEHAPDSVVPMRVTVNEGSTRRVRTGAGWSSAECFDAEARWSGRNFLGGARHVVLRGRTSNLLAEPLHDSLCGQSGTGVYSRLNWLVSAEFTQPWLFSSRNSATAALYAERQSLPDVFVRRAVGANLGITRSVGRGTAITLSYRPQLAELDAAEIYFCISFLVCDPADIDLLQGRNRLSPLGLTLTRNRTNRAISPTGGYTALLDLESAGRASLSDFAYHRVIAEATGYREPVARWVMAGRLRGGWLESASFLGALADDPALGVAHPQKRFYGGGASSVRGYAQSQLGPRVLTIGVEELLRSGASGEPLCTPQDVLLLTCDASGLSDSRFLPRPTGGSMHLEGNLEIRFPLWGPNVQGAGFTDVGQIWQAAGDFRVGDIEVTPGLGVRYITPIGPVRVDVAYRLASGQHLQVVTSQIRPFDPLRDAPEEQLQGPDGTLPFVPAPELALLGPRVRYGEGGAWSLNRFQLHFSIGQAF